MITENLSTLKIHKLTQAQYDRELEAGNLDETALYLTPEEEIDLSGYTTVEQLNTKAEQITSAIPTSLKNPYKLTFSGAVTGEYDGSTSLDVEIPVATDGYTPVKGVDYWTQEEQDAIADEANTIIAEELAKRGQLKPEFANSIEECTDTTKLYVLPDGFIYAYIKTTVQSEPVNLLPLATDTDRKTIYNGVGYVENTRLSSSGSTSAASGIYTTGFISAKENDALTIEGLKGIASGTSLYLIAYDSTNTKTGYKSFGFTADGILSTAPTWYTFDPENNIVTIPLTSAVFGAGFDAVRFATMSVDGLKVYVNKDAYSGTTTVEQWANTDHAFVPTDYEDRIVALEKDVADLKEVGVNDNRVVALETTSTQHTSRITSLETLTLQHSSEIAALKEAVESGNSGGTTGEDESYIDNHLLLATDLDRTTIYGGDYNGDGKNDGYITGYRLSSSGSTTAHSSFCSSGFIPAQKDDVLRIKGVLPYNGDTSAYVIAYDSSNAVTGSISIAVNGDRSDWVAPTDGRHTYENGVLIIPLTESNFGTGFNAIRFSAGTIDENTVVTINEKTTNGEDVDYLAVIRNWDAPIYDRVPVFLMDSEKPAVTSDEKTVNAVYAKYDALVAANPRYITRTDMGMCSDGVTPVYRYDFREPEPHHQSGMQWSETKPTVIIVSGIHNEWGGIYSLYYAMEEIVNNPELDDLRRNVHFVIVPVMNPYCIVGAYSDTYHVKNANGVEIHRNFEVGFKYPADSGYIAEGEIHHGGTQPLSEVETQYINNIFKEYPDAALFMTCHSAQRDTRWGTGFIWASTATEYTCNLGYRLVDKMSKAWHKKYGTTWEEGCIRENEYVLANTGTYPYATALEDGDYRAGHAHVSSTNGTETRQATKYGIQGANVEVLDTFWVLDSTNLGSKVTTHGAETYINYLLMYMGCYDHKDKKLYYVG
ncbi:MAG: hypothetical protein II240_08865 [Bacteroidaceae bacterium]|nr:hypothetical protein [Bacteroidaceae bacterium]